MSKVILKSKDIKEYVYGYLKKNTDSLVEEKELEEITTLSLNAKKFDGTNNDFYWEEIKYLKNITSCTINGFVINNKIIEALNQLPKLQIIVWNHCKFETSMQIKNNLRVVYFTYCEINQFENFKNCYNIEKIQILECGKIDVKDFGFLKRLKELYIYNSKIINSIQISQLEKLEILKLDGSLVDTKYFQDQLRKDIQFSYNEKYILY